MKKNILIFRTANLKVMEQLINYILNNYSKEQFNIYCVVQENSVGDIKNICSKIKIIKNPLGYFNYNIYKESFKYELKSIKYSEVFIPSSTEEFSNFDEVLKIVGDLKYNNLIYFDCNGNILNRKKILMERLFNNKFGDLIYYVIILIYTFLFKVTTFSKK